MCTCDERRKLGLAGEGRKAKLALKPRHFPILARVCAVTRVHVAVNVASLGILR